MTTLEAQVLEALRPNGRLLYPETLAAILRQPRSKISRAVRSLQSKRLAYPNQCGQWQAWR